MPSHPSFISFASAVKSGGKRRIPGAMPKSSTPTPKGTKPNPQGFVLTADEISAFKRGILPPVKVSAMISRCVGKFRVATRAKPKTPLGAREFAACKHQAKTAVHQQCLSFILHFEKAQASTLALSAAAKNRKAQIAKNPPRASPTQPLPVGPTVDTASLSRIQVLEADIRELKDKLAPLAALANKPIIARDLFVGYGGPSIVSMSKFATTQTFNVNTSVGDMPLRAVVSRDHVDIKPADDSHIILRLSRKEHKVMSSCSVTRARPVALRLISLVSSQGDFFDALLKSL